MKAHRILNAALAAALITIPAAAWSQDDGARLASQYAGWAGGKSNADALVAGLHSGTPVTLVTSGPNRAISMAGFTPNAPMSYESIRGALGSAQRTLAGMGIAHPSAEQIQAALIGGDVTNASGATRQVAGVVGARGAPGPVASR
jgi:hypothetical protein